MVDIESCESEESYSGTSSGMSSSEEDLIFSNHEKQSLDKKDLKIWNNSKKFRKEKLVQAFTFPLIHGLKVEKEIK